MEEGEFANGNMRRSYHSSVGVPFNNSLREGKRKRRWRKKWGGGNTRRKMEIIDLGQNICKSNHFTLLNISNISIVSVKNDEINYVWNCTFPLIQSM